MFRCGFLVLTLLAVTATASQAAQPRALKAAEIRQRLVGKMISDGAHWHYHLKPNGTIDAIELSRPRKGKWRIAGDRLCITILGGAAPDECWDVAQDGKKLTFGVRGDWIYWVKVDPPPRHGQRVAR
jgi:hypothetical protein